MNLCVRRIGGFVERVERARQPQCAMQNVGYADKEMIVYQIFVY